LDYIGTRLHGGIRALQHKRRSIIIAIDSRAKSFKNDFNLPVIDKDNLNQLSKMINSNFKTEIILKKDRINEFKTKLTEFIKNM
jgi:polysaccharide pyruvyl transferase WcaK-like protein